MIYAMRALLALMVLARTAHAGEPGDPAARFATELGVAPTAVHEVAGFEIGVADFTHVMVGRFDPTSSAVVMVKCETDCVGRRVDLGTVDGLDLLGVYDLQGEPTQLGGRIAPRDGYAKAGGAKKMKFPVLAVRARESKSETITRNGRTTTRKETRAKLYLISLVDADRGSIVFMDDIAQQAGSRSLSRSFRLERSDAKGSTNLDLLITEKKTPTDNAKCGEPEVRFTLEDHHYRPKSYEKKPGC
jgi:hypothetical protein